MYEPLIDWWLTPTLGVFQLYRGVIVDGHTLQYAMQQTSFIQNFKQFLSKIKLEKEKDTGIFN